MIISLFYFRQINCTHSNNWLITNKMQKQKIPSSHELDSYRDM